MWCIPLLAARLSGLYDINFIAYLIRGGCMDRKKLDEYLGQYKNRFTSYGFKESKYKWQAVKNFQDHWDTYAFDLERMIRASLDGNEKLFGTAAKSESLTVSDTKTSEFTLPELAHIAADDVRAMFDNLYDENRDVFRRIKDFSNYVNIITEKNGVHRKMRIGSPYAVSVLLWLKYPEKYYHYDFGDIKWACEHLDFNTTDEKKPVNTAKQGVLWNNAVMSLNTMNPAYVVNQPNNGKNGGLGSQNDAEAEVPDIDRDFSENLKTGNALYDAVREVLKADSAFVEIYRGKLDASCAPDPELRILTSDVCSYIAANILESEDKDAVRWLPAGYDPEITKGEWIELLLNGEIFDEDALAVMARLKDNDGPASCNDLAQYYGKTKHYYNTQVTALAKRLIDKTACPVPDIEDSFSKYCSVMFLWRVSREFDDANMLWKLRPELDAALDEIDLSGIELYIDVVPRSRIKNYWLLNTNPKVWGFSHAAVGEVKAFSLYNDNGYKRRIFDNFLHAKEGDIVIGYESHPSNQIVGLGWVSAAHDDKYIYFEKTEGLASPIDYAVIRNNPELGKMEFFNNMQGSLFKVNQGEYDRIMDIIREENPLRDNTAIPKYSKADFLDEVYMSEGSYDELVEVLKTKKNIILQGAPGVGKTFTANRLAYSIMGEKDRPRIEFVQFHQNYSYEDFMLGYRPTDSGFELKYGIFYRFCLLAGNRPDKDYFFIIDEINRGNMSRIFGELLMMIEADYRGTTTTLSYNGLSFMVPKNLYIIGMMNTADRSLALIDYALRRRFGFYEIGPRFTSDGFRKYQSSLASPQLDRLIGKVIDLNREIENDPSLGRGFCIGHSYFCGREPGNCTTEWLNSVIDYDIVPTLREYWFDEPARTAKWERELKSAVEVMP